jgi:hypothetical protein
VGASGTNGVNGESVTVGKASASECKEGGAKLSNASGSAKACNGEKGVIHPGETLSQGATETGAWALGYVAALTSNHTVLVPISFPVPLSAPLDEEHVHYLEAGASSTAECPGSAVEPKAAEGNLCVYFGAGREATHLEIFNPGHAGTLEGGAATSGAALWVGVANVGAWGQGTWAVTAN